MRLSQIMMLLGGKFTSNDFTYTGSCEWVQEDDANWHIEFTTSGVFVLKKSIRADLYLLGGGQCGKSGSNYTQGTTYYCNGGDGGQGGFINILSGEALLPDSYTVTIGQGGTGGNGGAGGTTSLGTYSAPGGGSGATGYQGGASGGRGNNGNSATDGSNSIVYDFAGINRGGGGSGGQRASQNTKTGSWSYTGFQYPRVGGLQGGGGGNGSSTTYYPAKANYGGGGGGRNCSSSLTGGRDGSSGVIQIRNAR